MLQNALHFMWEPYHYTIVGVPGSYAEIYAQLYGFNFVSLTESQIKIENDMITGVEEGTTAALLKKAVGMTIIGANGKPLNDSSVVSTGDTASDGTNTYTIVVLGDIDGDGFVDSYDCLLLKKALVGSYKLEGAYLRAACISSSDTPDSLDYLRLKKHINGTQSLYS